MGNGTNIGRVRGHGSAHSGSHHWLIQRSTAIGMLVLGLWLVLSLLHLPDLQYATVREWLSRPLAGSLTGLLVVTAFWHARLGMQVMIEDYFHDSANRVGAMVLLNLATFAGAGFGLLCVIRLALGA